MNHRAAERLAANALDALRETMDAVAAGRPADAMLATMFHNHRDWGSRDRRFISAIVFSHFRWRGWLDGLEIHHAAALAYSLDATEPHIAQTSLVGNKLPVWGCLPFAEKMLSLGGMLGKTLTHEMLVPNWLPAAVADPGHRLVESFQTRPPTWLRTHHGETVRVLSALRTNGATPRVHPLLPHAIAFDGGINLDLVRREAGPVFDVQDIASQAVGFVCDPKPGRRWWDVCAGAGGKSLHLADLLRGRGEVIATDIRKSALDQLARRAAAGGYKIIRALPPEKTPDGLFDGVLVDAPCSGIGTWSRNPDMRWRTTADDVHRSAQSQTEILLRAADFVKPGGTLVFAVCTITRAETTDIVAAFQSARPGFIASPFANPLADRCPLISDLCILPSDGPGDGMFIARWHRT